MATTERRWGRTATMALAAAVLATATALAGLAPPADAQHAPRTRVQGVVWSDVNGDGWEWSKEPRVAGVVVELWDATKTTLVDTAITDDEGWYRVQGPAPGSYRVRVVLPFPGDRFSPLGESSTIHPDGPDAGFTDVLVAGPDGAQFLGTKAGLIVAVAPPDDVAAEPGGAMAVVSWDQPPTHPIDGYTVVADPGGAQLQVPGWVRSVPFLGLAPGTAYTFRVQASALGVASPWSGASTPVAVAAPAHTFPDVGPGNPFAPEITWAAEVGLAHGDDAGRYLPTATLTRQAMSAFLYRLNGSPLGPDPTCAEAPFHDVPASNPFCGEITWMRDAGISVGKPNGTYEPDRVVTRQAMARFLYRSAHGGADPLLCPRPRPFRDVFAGDDLCPAIAWLAQTGIATGYEDGTFRPHLALTRQAMAGFLYRYAAFTPGAPTGG